jgi:ribosomal protein S27AE
MNFLETITNEGIQLDLKYCERCGGLWLRPHGTDGVYCAACGAYFAERPKVMDVPARKPRRRRARKVVEEGEVCSLPVLNLEGVAVEVWG